MFYRRNTIVLLSSLLLLAPIEVALSQQTEAPKLILQITVDQLRGDLPQRYLKNMGDGGFRYLLDNGVVYKDAHHAHATTETIVGHTTLATGTYPSFHGMVGNTWFDRALNTRVYNIEDSRFPLLTSNAGIDEETEIDPTQTIASTDGRSPLAILTSTFSDEISIASVGQAKIFGVSVKDRSAVATAGHAGKAFWYSKSANQFVTSSFYYDEYPEWVNQFNDSDFATRYADQDWELSNAKGSYLFGDKDDAAWETDLAGYGRTFPHSYGAVDSPYFTTFLTVSPAGDEMTLAFAKQLIQHEEIGADDITDYLSISFSSTDYVGHMFGPSSLEAEDNILRLDRTLAELLTFIDNEIGMENVLVVLSADHGGPEVPPQLQEHGLEAAYVDPGSWDKAAGIARLKQEFGIGDELILDFFTPYVYLNRELIQSRGLNQAEVEEAVANEISLLDGVSLAFSSSALTAGRIAETGLTRLILNSHHPKRSGDIFVVFEPHRFINDFDGLMVSSTHGSPWNYDTFVPIIFLGAGVEAQTVYRRVETVDVATTLSAFLGIKKPSSAVGNILPEVMPR